MTGRITQLVAALSMMAGIVVANAETANAQVVRDFTARFSDNKPGDIALIGNTVLTCPPGQNSCSDVLTGVLTMGDIANNNPHDMIVVDVDNDATTFNSSQAIATLPPNARVVWAGLYWGGRTEQGSMATGTAAPDRTNKNKVKFRSPTTGGYIDVTATQCDEAGPHGTGGVTGGIYQCFAEVTSSLPSDGNGTYTVANLQTGTGMNRFGGWGLVLAYEDPSQPLRNIVVYDGFARVTTADFGGDESVTINLSGFRSPASGDVVTRVGAIAYEGDRGATGDSFNIDGVPVSDTFNDAANFFNAGITELGNNITTRSPAFFNNLGFDLKLTELVNFLNNNSTSATLTLDTSGDNYFPGAVTFATVLYAPDIQVEKTAEDINGDNVSAGDIIEYTIVVRNDGGDAARDVSIEDIIPARTTYVAGSGSVDGSSRTDGSDGDGYTFNAGTNSLTVNIGTGATGSMGGRLAPGSTTTVKFQVEIDSEVAVGARIENQAVVSFITETLNIPSVVISDGDPVNPGADGTITVVDEVPTTIIILDPLEGEERLDRRPTITGKANPNSTVVVTVNGSTFEVTADANGDWSYTPAADLPLGPVSVTATIKNTTTTDTVNFTIVESGVEITTPVEDEVTDDFTPTISGKATPGATIEISIDGGAPVTVVADPNGDWSYTPTMDLSEGPHTVTAKIPGTQASDDVTFSITDDAVNIDSPADGSTISTRTPIISGTANPNATVELSINGNPPINVTADANGNWSYEVPSDLPLGANSVTATSGTAMDTSNFTINIGSNNNNGPNVTIDSPADGSTVSTSTPIISGTSDPNATIELSINGGAPVTVTADANGNWFYKVPDELPAGSNSVTATNGPASDSANFTVGDGNNGGNNGTNNGNSDGPMVTIDTPADGDDSNNPPTFSGTATPGADVEIFIDGRSVGTTTADDDGNWSFELDEPISPGDHEVTAIVEKDGEQAEDTVTFNALPPEGRIARGGAGDCTNSTTHQSAPVGPSALLFVLGLVGLVGLRRRKSASVFLSALVAVGLVASASTPAAAQETNELTAFQVEHFEPLPSQTRNILNVSTADTLGHLESGFGLFMHLVNDPLQLSDPNNLEDKERIINNQVKAELYGVIGLFDILELGLVAPLVLAQSGDDLASFGRPDETLDGATLADFRFIPKVAILPNKGGGLGIAALIPMYIPLGDEESFNSDGSFRLEPRLVVDYKTTKGLNVSANVAYQLLRPDRTVYNFKNDDILRWGLGARVPLPVERLAAIGSVFGNISFADAQAIEGVDPSQLDKGKPVEILGGVEYGITPTLFASAGGGTGLTQGVGAPDFRFFASLGYAPAGEEPEQILDTDGDGILDPEDACPAEPEDKDNFEDEDGCPDPDNDNDTILDVDDDCPLDPEDLDGFEDENGCPDPDNDQDEILDINDSCPNEPEDKDGFEDENGCPDPDNDKDGILDINDSCPMEPELMNGVEDEDGCPEKDTDKDGIIDPIDKCPTEPETYNGKDDEDGCPDGTASVVITETEIKILQKVFFDTNKATIKKKSYKLLNTVATVLAQNPQVTKVRIEGHTDDMGKDAYNLDLSKRRAAAVREYLTERGVDAGRLTSEGYGEERPLCEDIPTKQLGKRSKKKAIKACRADNRRVEFKILEINGRSTDSQVIKSK